MNTSFINRIKALIMRKREPKQKATQYDTDMMSAEREVLSALKYLETAFDRPRYFGESSRAVIRNNNSQEILRQSVTMLDRLSQKYPTSAQFLFLSGIASRHLGDERTFAIKVKSSLNVDPDFVEAFIAEREGANYLDPFHYLSVEDTFNNPNFLRPSSSGKLLVNAGKIDQVRDGLNVLPLIVIKYPESKFRKTPLASAGSALKLELYVVTDHTSQSLNAPGFDPINFSSTFFPSFVVCPLIIDDEDDPFWKLIGLNLWPTVNQMGGIEIRHQPDYQPFLGRYIAMRFSAPPYKSAIIIFNENNRVIFRKIVNFHPFEIRNLEHIYQILKVLPNEPHHPLMWDYTNRIYEKYFHLNVMSEDGKTYPIPKGSRAEQRQGKIFNLVMHGDRIGLDLPREPLTIEDLGNDIFLSHSHKDEVTANSLARWLKKCWPELKLYISDKNQTEIAHLFPIHYLQRITSSRCFLFLCTKNSMDSPYVQMEISSAFGADLDVVTLLKEDISRIELANIYKQDPALKIDLNRVIELESDDAESRLINHLTDMLNLQTPKTPVGKIKDFHNENLFKEADKSPTKEGKIAAISNILDLSKQTREKALIWLQLLEKEVIHKTRLEGIETYRFPRLHLEASRIAVVMLVSDENRYFELMQPLKPLIDRSFLNYLSTTYDSRETTEDVKIKLRKLIAVTTKILLENEAPPS